MAQISSTDLEQVRSRFFDSGESVAGWARLHGFSLQLTYSVLSGRLRARRGKSHEIAIALGIKRRVGNCNCDAQVKLQEERNI